MKLKLENKTFLFLALIVLFILLLDFFLFLRPQLRALAQISRNSSSLARELKTARKDIFSIGQYRQRLSSLKEKILSVGERVSQEEEIPVILDSISNIAKQSFLKINYIKPEREAEKLITKTQTGSIYELPITIQARCGYHQLGVFISSIESSTIAMDVSSLEILPSPEDPLRHKVKLTVATYILKK